MINKIDILKNKLDEKLWTDKPSIIESYLHEQRGNLKGKSPLLIRPKNTDDVIKIVKICNKYKISIVPQGGRTGLCGGTIANNSNDEVLLSTERMNKINEINKNNFYIIAQSGCTLESIKKNAENYNRYFPLTLPSENACTIGGNISTNAGGSGVLKYGMTKDLVEGIEVVLPNGKILNTISQIKKDNRSFDPKYLHIGSEGTLGIITNIKLKLFPEIKSRAMAMIATQNIENVINFLSFVKSQCHEHLSAFEVNTNVGLNLINKFFSDIPIPFKNKYAWYTIFELSSSDNFDLESKIDKIITKAIEKKIVSNAIKPQNLKQYKDLWKTRELLSEAQRIQGNSIKHDISIPIDKIPFFLKKAQQSLIEFRKENILSFGHLADGNLHYNISKPKKMNDDNFKKLKKKINSNIFDLVYKLGGSFSAEHGIGLIKKKEFKKYTSSEEFMLKKNLKKLLDPNNIMNPGKIFN